MSVRDELFDFLSGRPDWQQDLARRLLQVGRLTDWEFEDALNVVKAAHGCAPEGVQVTATRPLRIDELPAPDRTGSARLTSFGRLRGVGAVSEQYSLNIAARGLTVVYGNNAAGKSTYVRGLKAICRSVHGSPVLQSDVFAAKQPGPHKLADLVLDAGTSGAPLSLSDVDLTAPPEHLGTRDIAVFDSDCAALYVSKSNRVEFIPAELHVLARLSEAQRAMRERVRAEAEAIKSELPDLREIAAGTQAAAFVATLHPDTKGTNPATLRQQAQGLSKLSGEENASLAELRAVLASQASANGQKDAAAARGDAKGARDLAHRLQDLCDRVGLPAAHDLAENARKARDVEEALSLAAQQFAVQPLEGIGTPGAWQQLWAAARTFSTAHSHAFPPAQGQPCPLCLQPLDGEAAQRMDGFERHVRSQLADLQRQAAAQLQSALGRIDAQQTGQARTQFLEGLREREPEMHEAALALLTDVDVRMAALRENPAMTPDATFPRQVIDRLRQWADAREQHAKNVLAAQDPAQEQRLRAQFNELDARAKLGARLLDINRWLQRLVTLKALRQAWRDLDHTNVSHLQTKLSKDTVTVDFQKVLDEERKALHVQHLPVDVKPKTELGTPHVALALSGANTRAKVESVVSEGEHRALSLAFFFAELRMSKGDGGVIIDDPCSSLDDQRRSAIVRRLVDLAKDRQVIVFTHDLALLFELDQRAGKCQVPTHFQHVWRSHTEVGRADGERPFRLMTAAKRVGSLKNDVQNWDDQIQRSNDDEWRRIDGFYDRLRKAWERTIEEKLLNGVVGRLQNGVHADNLKKVVVDDELRYAVDDAMTNTSGFLHDASTRAVGAALLTKADLEADLKRLSDFLDLVKRKQKTVEAGQSAQAGAVA